MEDARAVILDDHVGHSNQALDEVKSFGGTEVEGYAELVGIGVVEYEVGVQAGFDTFEIEYARIPNHVRGLGPLDLDDLGAQGP